MKKVLLVCICLAAAFSASACTDSRRARLFSYGDNAAVKCWSGGVVIYDGLSTGKVISEENSDGYSFLDSKTDKYMEVSGNCVIQYDPDDQ